MLAVLSSLAGLGTGDGALPTDKYKSVGYFLCRQGFGNHNTRLHQVARCEQTCHFTLHFLLTDL
jgi:hypothetical protein